MARKRSKNTSTLETMVIDKTTYFPCRICSRLFKEEKLASEHFQKCKPRIYLSAAQITDDKSKTNDPYEIVPEEMDLEDNIGNGAKIDKKWSKRLKGKTKTICTPRKENKSRLLPKKNESPKKRNRLNEEEIKARLNNISEALKKRKENQNYQQTEIQDDEDEDEERRAIEVRLLSLNRDYSFPEDDLEEQHKPENIPEPPIQEVIIITNKPDGQLHTCKHCPEVFLTPVDLLRHTRKEHTYPRIKMAPSEIEKLINLRDRSRCPICQKPLSSTFKSIYVKHLLTHSCVSEHQCPICKKKFKRKDHMRAHQKRHIV